MRRIRQRGSATLGRKRARLGPLELQKPIAHKPITPIASRRPGAIQIGTAPNAPVVASTGLLPLPALAPAAAATLVPKRSASLPTHGSPTYSDRKPRAYDRAAPASMPATWGASAARTCRSLQLSHARAWGRQVPGVS